MNLFKNIVLTFLILCCLTGFTQDIHFSQFFANPMLLNPALTANMECNKRMSSDYRSQWKSVTVPYIEKAVYLEGKYFPEVLNNDWLGLGCYLDNSVAGDVGLKNTTGKALVSYHKGLMQNNELFASLGLGLGMFNKSIELDKLKFDSQWDGYTFNSNQSSGESFRNVSLYRFDMDAGITLTYSPSTQIGIPPYAIYVGAAMRHLSRPGDSFFEKGRRLGVAKLYHAGSVIKISEKIIVQPGFFFSRQKKATEILLGSNALFFNGRTHLLLGFWGRLSGDIIPVVGLECLRTTLSITYDVNISSLKVASNNRGGLEISFTKSFNCAMKRAIASGRNFFQYPYFISIGPPKL